jgi:YebC/PmpR family DNA-binding regulatory protein
MSGHSHWATIRRKKEATDAKKGAVYTRLAREIVIAVREGGGGDPSSNVRLQLAMERARAQNMPKDNIERAIRRGTGEGKDGVSIEEVVYEGFGPHGVALLISVETDNRNRSVAEIRHVLNRYGGNMAEAGAVSWQFKKISYFSFPMEKLKEDTVFELAVEAGADDVTFDEGYCEIFASPESYKDILVKLSEAKIIPEEAELRFVPNTEMEVEDEDALSFLRVQETLEELDDVQAVYHNLSISESVLAKLEEA